jgi:hypothetical protein
MEKYKVKKSTIMDALMKVDELTSIYLDIESGYCEYYTMLFMSTTREEIEHYVMDNWYRFIELPNYKKINYFGIVDDYIDSLCDEELKEEYLKLDKKMRKWSGHVDSLLYYRNYSEGFKKYRYDRLLVFLDGIIEENKDKMEVIDDL